MWVACVKVHILIPKGRTNPTNNLFQRLTCRRRLKLWHTMIMMRQERIAVVMVMMIMLYLSVIQLGFSSTCWLVVFTFANPVRDIIATILWPFCIRCWVRNKGHVLFAIKYNRDTSTWFRNSRHANKEDAFVKNEHPELAENRVVES